MDFGTFERLVLRVLFESDTAVTAVHLAYLGGVSVRAAERHLARMVAAGTLFVRANAAGQVEYYFPGRKSVVGDPGIFESLRRPTSNPLTAVMLSMVVPGAGHIYAGRTGVGVAWMATTLAGYACFFLPGLFLHGLCLVSAANVRQVT